MDINSVLTSDEELKVIDEGTWVDDLDDAPGVALKVTGWSSRKAQKLLDAKRIAIRKKNRGREITSEQSEKLHREVLVEAILLDWKGFTDNGKEVPYSKETASKWILSRGGAKLAMIVMNAALLVDTDTSEFIEVVEKKSAPASSGA